MRWRNSLLVALAVVVLGVAVGLTATLSSPGTGQDWEYLVVSIGKVYYSDSPVYDCKYAPDDMRVLNSIGADGWELVEIVGAIGGDQEFVFKRPCS